MLKKGISLRELFPSPSFPLAISCLVLLLALTLPVFPPPRISPLLSPFRREHLYTRIRVRVHVWFSLPFSHSRSHSLAHAPLFIPGSSPFDPRPEGGGCLPSGKIDPRRCPTLTPTHRPRWVCIHAPPAPTFRSGSWVTATARFALAVNLRGLNAACTLL